MSTQSPWSPDGRWFLVSRVPSSTRAPAPGEEMEIGVVDYQQACETGVPQWRKVTSTRAYNMQQVRRLCLRCGVRVRQEWGEGTTSWGWGATAERQSWGWGMGVQHNAAGCP